MKLNHFYIIARLMAILMFLPLASCAEQGDDIPIDKQYYVEMVTLESMTKDYCYFRNDQGVLLRSRQGLSSYPVSFIDLTERLIIRYAFQFEESVIDPVLRDINLLAMSSVRTSTPISFPYDSTAILKRDPIKIESLWCGSNYLNVEASFNYLVIPHFVRLLEVKYDSTSTPRHVELELFHNKGNDPQGAYIRQYFSYNLNRYKTKERDTLDITFKALTAPSQETTFKRTLIW